MTEKTYIKTVYGIKDPILPTDFSVEVTKTGTYYYGHANYQVWGPRQATPYRSIHPTNSTDEAVDDAIEGAMTYARSYPSEVIFWEMDDIYFDLKGNKVSEKEIREKFKEYNQKNPTT